MTPLDSFGSSHWTTTVFELTGRARTFLGGLPGTTSARSQFITVHIRETITTDHTTRPQVQRHQFVLKTIHELPRRRIYNCSKYEYTPIRNDQNNVTVTRTKERMCIAYCVVLCINDNKQGSFITEVLSAASAAMHFARVFVSVTKFADIRHKYRIFESR